MQTLILFSGLLLLNSYCGCQLSGAAGDSSPAPAKTKWGFDTTGMDLSVAPGDDFYSYANGEWNRRTEIPADRTVVGTFVDLRYTASSRVRELLEEATKSSVASGSQGKAAKLYQAYMNEAAIEKIGDSPLRHDLARLSEIKSKAELAASMGQAFQGFGRSLYNVELAYDAKDPKHYAIYLGQGGLGLPNRDYYLEPQFAGAKLSYEAYIAEMLHFAAWPNAGEQAHAIVAFETRIALGSWSHNEERDPVKTYNPVKLSTLQSSIPNFAWRRFLTGAGLSDAASVVVTTNTSVPKLAQIFASTPLSTLKAWQAFHTTDTAAPFLPDEYVQAYFRFHAQTLGGQTALAPRWVRAGGFVNEAMGSAVGELYVNKYFPEASQEKITELVTNLREALEDRLQHLTWMSTSAKLEALHKLANLEIQIGRPKVWIDYTNLEVLPDDLYGDAEREKAFDWQRRVSQLHGLWNKSDWRFWPQYATAYTENGQLIFTAGILQAPFFDPRADAAINYGGIGSVIGHELSHSFDDQGRDIDAENRIRPWWTSDDESQFKKRADRLSMQYSTMQPLPGLHIKGDVTLGENIADLGGVTIALEAYHRSVEGRAAPILDGFTGDQRFFLGWAQVWREKHRNDDLRKLITTDVHAPGTARVNGVVRNMDTWYNSYSVRADLKLYLGPEERVRIW